MSVRWSGLLATGLSFLVVTMVSYDALSKPMSGAAVAVVSELGKVVQQPVVERRLNKEVLDACLAAVRGQDEDLQLAGILTLAHASDADSFEELSHAARSSNPMLAGASSYALAVRGVSGMGLEQQLAALSFRMGRATNAWERMFLANRIAVDHGEKGLPAIMLAAKDEKDPFTQVDMLYYLSQTKDAALRQEILLGTWSENHVFPERMAFLLCAITPGREWGPWQESARGILDVLRAQDAPR